MKIEYSNVTSMQQEDPLQAFALKVLGMRNAQKLSESIGENSRASSYEQQEALGFSRQNEREVDALVNSVLRPASQSSVLYH